MSDERTLSDRKAIFALGTLTFVLLTVRAFAARTIGFGDSEALYVSYALHPQAAYLDHPGLVGLFAHSIGAIDGPKAAHSVSSVLCSSIPWFLFAALRATGVNTLRSVVGASLFALVPEICVGLFAITPDLLLAPAWILSLACAATALSSETGSTKSFVAFVLAGFLAGIGAAAKVSGLLLMAALAYTYVRSKEHRSSAAPWIGLFLGSLTIVPVFEFENRWGFPMLTHRLVSTQAGAGVSLRNLGAVLGGQFAYLSPVVAVLVFVIARDLVRRRSESPVHHLLFAAFIVPLVPLLLFCLWSRVAEPHWLAPPLLALAIYGARMDLSKRWITWSFVSAGTSSLLVHAWILMPSLLRFAPASYDATLDISNELYGWPQAIEAVKEEVAPERNPHDKVTVVGPHWVVCAQLQAGLGRDTPVGCAGDARSDFDDWLPRKSWQSADRILFVTDKRFPTDVEKLFPNHARTSQSHVSILRAGRIVRVFTLTLIERRAAG